MARFHRAALVWLVLPACARASASTREHPGAMQAYVQSTSTGRVFLPPPYATPSADNPPRIRPRPAGTELHVPPGFHVNVFADGLHSARWLAVAPNGDVFAAEHDTNRVIVLRDVDHDGRADTTAVFATGLDQPFGLAFHPAGYLYVANSSGVVRFGYADGQTRTNAAPERICDLPGRGYRQHWTRTVLFSPDAREMFVSVGSQTNDSVESDARRAAISVYSPDGRSRRVFASGLRNAVGLAFYPGSRRLFAVVNERDGLGDDLVPDYLTEVRDGGFYGWPYAYFGPHEDPTHSGERPDLVARTVVPDLSLGAHVAALGLVFYDAGEFPAAYRGDAFVSLHGSWNRHERVGYDVVRVRFRNGRPTSEISPFVTGWLTTEGDVWGRPVGLAVARDGALLVADDGAQTIWRITYAGP